MKNIIKNVIIVLIILLIIVGIFMFFENKSDNNKLVYSDVSNERILIEKSIAGSGEFFYKGYIITESGNIYEYEFKDSNDILIGEKNINKISENKLKYVTQKIGNVSEKDLEKLKELLPTVEDTYNNIGTKLDGLDISIDYYNYNANKRITILQDGYEIKENSSINVPDILQILNKYEINIDSDIFNMVS